MAEAGLAGVFIASPVDDVFGRHSQNRRYVSGFSGSAGYVVVTATRAIVAVDSRYTEQAGRECVSRGFEVVTIKGKRPEACAQLLASLGLGRKQVGISGADMTFGEYSKLLTALGEIAAGDRPSLTASPPLIERLRVHKDAAEMAALQRSVTCCDAAYETVLESLAAGQNEVTVADAIDRAVRSAGGSGISFDTIVAGGPWSAMPHATPRDEPLRDGEMVVIDMGAIVDGYCSDLTRTTTMGPPDAKFREIYDIVFHAQRAAIEGVESGMTGIQADRLARDVIEAAGYGEQFGHGLGHGVGLEIHETPYLGVTSEDVLEEGMVFTIEPGIYIPGWGGVRIEDIVVLEGGRARVLSHANKLVPAGAQE